MSDLSIFTGKNLDRQGFDGLDRDAQARYAWPLRFTPAVGTTLVVTGLMLQSPIWLGSMALVTLSGAVLPHGMLLDVIYNVALRRLIHREPLPSTPAPRRFSYLVSTTLLAGSALSFGTDAPRLGWITGGAVAAGGTVLTVSLFCIGSWLYRQIFTRSAAENNLKVPTRGLTPPLHPTPAEFQPSLTTPLPATWAEPSAPYLPTNTTDHNSPGLRRRRPQRR